MRLYGGLRSFAGIFFLAAAGASSVQMWAQAKDIPKHGPAVVLFDGQDLSQFDTYFDSTGLNSDPGHVFQVEKGMIHVSGKEEGYLITKQEYKNYYLRAEFKWGENNYGEKIGITRDSGILYNTQGPNQVWPRSIEFQINEACTGDFWLTDGAALTKKDGTRVVGPAGANNAVLIDRFNKGVFKDVTGYRDPTNELEKPHGEWNVLELVDRGDGHVWQYVNGKLANEGTDAFPASGKIVLESEGSEVYFRNIKIYPLK